VSEHVLVTHRDRGGFPCSFFGRDPIGCRSYGRITARIASYKRYYRYRRRVSGQQLTILGVDRQLRIAALSALWIAREVDLSNDALVP